MPPGLLQWRPMTATDLPAVKALADLVHVAYPEDETVFADRLTHHPAGCFVLQGADAPVGYVISHPWQFARPPRLNTRLDRPALPPSTYYIHDLALLPAARGSAPPRPSSMFWRPTRPTCSCRTSPLLRSAIQYIFGAGRGSTP